MNKTSTSIIIGLVIVTGGLFFLFNRAGNTTSPVDMNPPQDTTPAATSSDTTSAPKASGYTLADVSKHGNSSSCWSAINGNVYDLTAWIAQHPGGEGAILSICGKDGTAAFNGQHGGAQRQAEILATFKIGALIK